MPETEAPPRPPAKKTLMEPAADENSGYGMVHHRNIIESTNRQKNIGLLRKITNSARRILFSPR